MVPRRLGSGSAIGAALVVAVVSFLGATLLTQLILARVGVASQSIARSAGPSIAHLSAMQTRVHRLSFEVQSLPERDAAWAPREAARGRGLLAEVRTRWRGYRAQDTYPGERPLWPLVDRQLNVLSTTLGEMIAAVRIGDAERSRVLLARIETSTRELDALLTSLIMINTNALTERAAAIEGTWREQALPVVVLHVLAVLAALLAGLLAFRAVRRYELLLEARTSELELFAGRLSHDLLNPIAAATTALDFLAGAATEPRTVRIAEAGRRGLLRAREIADALLAFAIAGGRASMNERAWVREVLGAAVEELRPVAAERGIDLALEPGGEAEVACAPGLLASAVSNLIGNAIKFMGDSPVRRIQVRARTVGTWVRIDVEDTGPGLAPEVAARVFEPFERGPDRTVPGTGLGLATVRRIAVGHCGRVEVDSRPGQGSRFTVILPAALPSWESEPGA